MKKIIKPIALAILAITSSSSVIAANQTSNFQATSTLTSSCVISADPISFETINPAATGFSTANGAIKTTCNKGTSTTIQISNGINSGNMSGIRKMAGTNGNTDKLDYNVYADSSYSTVLTTYIGTGTGVEQTLVVYGRIPLNQYIKPDNYSDTLIAAISY